MGMMNDAAAVLLAKKSVEVTYITWNPSDKHEDITLSDGNLTVYTEETSPRNVRATQYYTTGKRYMELTVGPGGTGNNFSENLIFLGLALSTHPLNDYIGLDHSDGWGICFYDGQIYHTNPGGSSYGSKISYDEVCMMAVNFDTHKVWWGKEGTWFNSGDPAAGTGEAFSSLSGNLYPIVMVKGSVTYPYETAYTNFGGSAFTYTPPSGFSGFPL